MYLASSLGGIHTSMATQSRVLLSFASRQPAEQRLLEKPFVLERGWASRGTQRGGLDAVRCVRCNLCNIQLFDCSVAFVVPSTISLHLNLPLALLALLYLLKLY